MVILIESGRMHRGRVKRRRWFYRRVVGAEAASPPRPVEGSGRGQLARRGMRILLATSQCGKCGEGIGGFVCGLGVVGDRGTPLWGGLVVEERVDAAHCVGEAGVVLRWPKEKHS
jgi:hypothetical protein